MPENVGSVWLSYKNWVYKVWWNCLKFHDKMDLPVLMRTCKELKYRHAICLKFGDNCLIFQIKVVLEAKGRSTIKENLFLHCRKFSVFVIAAMI